MDASGTAWHRGDPETRHQRVFSAVQALRRQQQGLEDEFKRSLSSYEERRVDTLGPDLDYARHLVRDDMRFDITRSVVDTIAVEVLQSNPRPMLLTEAGDYQARRDARLANRAVEGLLLEGGLYDDRKRDVVLDAMVCKTGFVEVNDDPCSDEVTIERVFPWEVYVDPYDAHYGRPSRILRVQTFEKALLCEKYPDHADVIRGASANLEHGQYGLAELGASEDRVSVVKGWSMPHNGRPGVRTLCVAGATLEDRNFWGETLPVVDYRWAPPRKGFWGSSVVEQLRRPQACLDRLQKHIDDTHRLMASAKLIGPPGTKWHKWDNEIGGFFERPMGDRVDLWQGTGAPAELYADRERVIRWAYEKVGASQLSAQSQVPRGLDSGPSLRIYLAVGAKRFTMQVEGLESFYVRLALAVVDAAKRIARRQPDFRVIYESRAGGNFETIEWSNVNLGDVARWRCFPTSMLPAEPAGKLAALQELFAANLIDRQTFFRLTDYPDFETERSTINAPRDLVEKALDDILADNRQILPESVWNIPMAILIGGLTYQRVRLEMGSRPDESRLRKLRTFVVHATKLLDRWIEDQKKVTEALAGPAAAPGLPMPPPGAAPLPGAPGMAALPPPPMAPPVAA